MYFTHRFVFACLHGIVFLPSGLVCDAKFSSFSSCSLVSSLNMHSLSKTTAALDNVGLSE